MSEYLEIENGDRITLWKSYHNGEILCVWVYSKFGVYNMPNQQFKELLSNDLLDTLSHKDTVYTVNGRTISIDYVYKK